MKLFIDIVMKRIYLLNTVAWNYRKKIGFPVCKKENFAGLQAHRKRGKSARASPTPHHTLNEERSARFIAQPLSALINRQSLPISCNLWWYIAGGNCSILEWTKGKIETESFNSSSLFQKAATTTILARHNRLLGNNGGHCHIISLYYLAHSLQIFSPIK